MRDRLDNLKLGQVDPVDWLREEYDSRRKKNGAYSLRAYAKHLNCSIGRISEILSRKRPLTVKMAHRFANSLQLSQEDKSMLIDAVLAETKVRREKRFLQLEEEQFQLVAEWHHYAILSLMNTEDFLFQPEWIGERLGISADLAQNSLETMLRIGLISKNAEGRLIRITESLTTTKDVASEALQAAHRENLMQALRAIDEITVDLRSISSTTMAIDPEKIPLAKEMIRQFRRSLANVMEAGACTEVYNINVQLVPLTKRK